MSVKNMTFMVDKLGEDCAPLQFVRELTQNAIESILKTPEKRGELRWDVAWNHHALTNVCKLAVIDTGVGMTGDEMVEYINKLSSSMHEQSRHGNFGIGAKISALPRNHEGVLYLSWKEGVGYMVQLWRDPDTDDYGLKRWQWPNGMVEHWAYADDALKPEPILDYGTMVVLLGNTEKENTMQPPSGTPMPSRWALRYLNTRYFCFPSGITVRSREGWEKPQGDRHNFLREVTGQKHWLDSNCECNGSVELDTANAHWWILKEGIDDDSGHNAGGGHVAALYHNELYELVAGRAGVARLQGFGVIFGCSRVVLYLEPRADMAVTANIARTQLLCDGEPLPWSEWACQFREKMPQPICDLMEEVSAKSVPSDHRASIRERLKQIRDLFRFSRYRPASSGKFQIDDDVTSTGGSPKARGLTSGGSGGGGGRGGTAGDVYALFLTTRGGLSAEEVNSPPDPKRDWISLTAGTRSAGDLEDRAARYLPDQNRLLINADFRVFTDMVDRWAKRYSHAPGARAVVEQVAQEWFEQQLVETVMGAWALRQSGQWTLDELKQLWSEEALTAAVLPRYHVDNSIKRGLGSRLGTLKEQAA